MTDNISLVSITLDDKEQFILDNQRAFKYGAQEEMTEQREQSRTCSSYAESRRNSSTAQFGMCDDRMEEGEEVISRKTIERSMNGEYSTHVLLIAKTRNSPTIQQLVYRRKKNKRAYSYKRTLHSHLKRNY